MSHQVQYKELRVSQLCESPSLLLMFHPIHQQSVAQTYAVFTMSCPVLTKHPVVTEHLYKQRILQLGPSNSPDVSVRNAAWWFHHIHVPASQPPFWKWWFLLDDDKPYYKKLVVRKPTSRKWWLDFQGNSIPKMTHTHTAAILSQQRWHFSAVVLPSFARWWRNRAGGFLCTLRDTWMRKELKGSSWEPQKAGKTIPTCS